MSEICLHLSVCSLASASLSRLCTVACACVSVRLRCARETETECGLLCPAAAIFVRKLCHAISSFNTMRQHSYAPSRRGGAGAGPASVLRSGCGDLGHFSITRPTLTRATVLSHRNAPNHASKIMLSPTHDTKEDPRLKKPLSRMGYE